MGGVAQPSSQTDYDVFGRAWKTVDEQGLASESTFDKRGLVIESRTQSRDATCTLVWNVTRTVYDGAGRATFVTDSYLEGTSAAEIRGTYRHYNALGQVDYSQRIQNVNIVISGAAGNLVSEAPTGYTVVSTSTTTYDANGRTTQTTDAFGRVSQTLYDHFGNVVETRSETKDAGGTTLWLVTRTVYDDLGRATCTIDPYTVAASTALGGGNSPAVYAFLACFPESSDNSAELGQTMELRSRPAMWPSTPSARNFFLIHPRGPASASPVGRAAARNRRHSSGRGPEREIADSRGRSLAFRRNSCEVTRRG